MRPDLLKCTREKFKSPPPNKWRIVPEISLKSYYLCKVDGQWLCGRFSKEWFGWVFQETFGSVSYQLDGEDGSTWGQIYRISEGKD